MPSAKVVSRITSGLRHYKPILAKLKEREANESDTGLIIVEMLSDLFGYDKVDNITTEHRIRNTFADIAVKIDGKVCFLIEVKSICTELNDHHVRQAVDYCANLGVEWVILTNAAAWRLYRVQFTQPIEKILVGEFDLLDCDPKDDDLIETIACLTKEGFSRDDLKTFAQQKEIGSKFSIAAMLMGDHMIDEIRKELRRLSDVNLDVEVIRERLKSDVIRPEIIAGEDAGVAQAAYKHLLKAFTRKRAMADSEKDEDAPAIPTTPVPQVGAQAAAPAAVKT